MEKLATEDVVWRTCERLKAEGRRISGRAVIAEVGGSLSTVLRYIETWRAHNIKAAPAAAEIPVDLQEAIRRALGQTASDATEALRQQIEETSSREAEALEALERSEAQIAALEKNLAASHAQIIELRQAHEKDSAVSTETITGLREQVNKLEQENDHLIRAGETARTEAAKAQLQVERADLAASKADARVVELESRIAELMSLNAEAEKGKAVANRHSQDLTDQVAKLEARLQKADEKIALLETGKTELARELNSAQSARSKAEGASEQMNLRIQESAATIEQLRKELAVAQKDTADKRKSTSTDQK